MEKEILKEYEGKKVKVVLKNDFIYTNIIFSIKDDGIIVFKDRSGDLIHVEPSYISMISEVNGGDNGNKSS